MIRLIREVWYVLRVAYLRALLANHGASQHRARHGRGGIVCGSGGSAAQRNAVAVGVVAVRHPAERKRTIVGAVRNLKRGGDNYARDFEAFWGIVIVLKMAHKRASESPDGHAFALACELALEQAITFAESLGINTRDLRHAYKEKV